MNDVFITAFVKAAVELGANDDTIARLFKRAMVDPNSSNMFKENVGLNEQGPNQQVQIEQNTQQLKQIVQQNPQLLPILKQYVG